LNNSFLSTKSTSNLHFGKQSNHFKSNKNILFNVEVTKNLQEKQTSKLKSKVASQPFSKPSSPRVAETLLSPRATKQAIESKPIHLNLQHLKKRTDNTKTKSFELASQLNTIRDKTRSVLEKYQASNLALFVRIRSMSSNNLENETLELNK
jgi:hypothetical protein